ncbi:uncharacterized protein LOC125195998 isoform X3 [Salvia hispanica]|uniref:uncharacterized protein LOC125195998 isoform X3 n=1 Tax=Salvia hispanica TaxID=49212 RepID=UPI0020090886|nr:uncharacterized protein LOC125195998 isoform X3 [Salvia hispanica]
MAPFSCSSSPQFHAIFTPISTNNFSCSPSPYSSYPNHSHRRRRNYLNLAAFSGLKNILTNQNLTAQAMSTSQGNLASNLASKVASPRDIVNIEDRPDHLLVLVHGILASPSDWTYFDTELKRRVGKKFLIYASSCNMYTKTFTGIDGAGKRLADEVIQVVKKTEGLKKISFLAHSLGGLFARYAIAVLYTPGDVIGTQASAFQSSGSSNKGLIAGMEAINFITLATPHLGVRGNRQLPFLLGVPFLEKLAAPIAPIFTGRTGSQLFLTDGKPSKPPLLLRMASDCEEGKFISALGAFRCRVLYANVSYDHMVGWRTSSIRREKELFKQIGLIRAPSAAGLACLAACVTRVAALNLSYMNLSGSIPPQLGQLSFLASLDLTSNLFSGALPHELSFLHS